MIGTYVAVKVLKPCSSYLYKFCQDKGIPTDQHMFEHDLHTTLIYSRKPCPDIITMPNLVHEAYFNGFDMFSNSHGEKCVLVMKLNAPTLVQRHLLLMEQHQATYDFESYVPHITLSYDFMGDISTLLPYTKEILLSNEWIEELE
jgi:hypothetical protein